MWATPTQSGNYNRKGASENSGDGLAAQAARDFGRTTPGSSEGTGKLGALNPDFAAWLMGFPAGWLNFADSETPSSRRSSK